MPHKPAPPESPYRIVCEIPGTKGAKEYAEFTAALRKLVDKYGGRMTEQKAETKK